MKQNKSIFGLWTSILAACVVVGYLLFIMVHSDGGNRARLSGSVSYKPGVGHLGDTWVLTNRIENLTSAPIKIASYSMSFPAKFLDDFQISYPENCSVKNFIRVWIRCKEVKIPALQESRQDFKVTPYRVGNYTGKVWFQTYYIYLQIFPLFSDVKENYDISVLP